MTSGQIKNCNKNFNQKTENLTEILQGHVDKYGYSFVAKLSGKKIFFEKIFVFDKMYIICKKKCFYTEKKFYSENAFYRKKLFLLRKI